MWLLNKQHPDQASQGGSCFVQCYLRSTLALTKKYGRVGVSTAGCLESSRDMPIKSIVFPVPGLPLTHSNRHGGSDSSQFVNAVYLLSSRIHSYTSVNKISFWYSIPCISSCGFTTRRSWRHFFFLLSACIFHC
jgi:hypothetical protein